MQWHSASAWMRCERQYLLNMLHRRPDSRASLRLRGLPCSNLAWFKGARQARGCFNWATVSPDALIKTRPLDILDYVFQSLATRGVTLDSAIVSARGIGSR